MARSDELPTVQSALMRQPEAPKDLPPGWRLTGWRVNFHAPFDNVMWVEIDCSFGHVLGAMVEFRLELAYHDAPGIDYEWLWKALITAQDVPRYARAIIQHARPIEMRIYGMRR